MSATIGAVQLCGEHIDEIVVFEWMFDASEVDATVTGQLREVHHVGSGDVVVWLTGERCLTGDKSEFVLSPEQEVTIK